MIKSSKKPEDEFVTQYLHFCRSPLRTEAEVGADLARLSTLPMVKLMAFADESKVKGTLMIGLKTLIIQNPETKRYHYIGDFIVYITRYRRYPEWVADFRLVNLNPICCEEGYTYFHPHMMTTTDAEIGEVADICISQGRFPIFQYIRKGQIDLAMELITNLLQSLGPDRPFYPICMWPRARFWREPWPTQKMLGQ